MPQNEKAWAGLVSLYYHCTTFANLTCAWFFLGSNPHLLSCFYIMVVYVFCVWDFLSTIYCTSPWVILTPPLQKYHSIVTCDTLPKQSRAQPICHTFWLTFSIHSCSLVTFPWSFPIVLEFYQIYRNVCQFFWHPHVSRNFWLSCDAQKAAFMSSIHLTTICTSMKNNILTHRHWNKNTNWAQEAWFAKVVQ